jgi:anti-sigma factor RsiW
MNGHFSPERISRWMIGQRTPQDEEHARQCPECAAKVAAFESAIARFRESVRDSGEQCPRPGIPLAAGVPRGRLNFAVRTYRWAPVAAALALLAAVPIYTSSMARRRQAEMARADAALLEQVDAGISRAVPAPMEPLVKLVSWNTNRATKTGETR